MLQMLLSWYLWMWAFVTEENSNWKASLQYDEKILKLQALKDFKPERSKVNTSGLLRTRIFNPTFGGCSEMVSVSTSFWLSLHMLCPRNTVSNLASSTSATMSLCLHWLHHSSILWFFPPSWQMLRFPLPEIRRWGEWRVMGWVKSKDGVCDDKGSRTGKCGEKRRRGGSWGIGNACKTQIGCVIEPPALARQSSKQHYFCLVTINQ